MKVIYIAGKYRGPNAWAIEQNIRAAEEVAARVWAAGHVALCPHSNARHMLPGLVSDDAACDGNLELLRRCDAVLLVSNWQDSAGARAEVAEAERLGLPVFGRRVPADGEDIPSADPGLAELWGWVQRSLSTTSVADAITVSRALEEATC